MTFSEIVSSFGLAAFPIAALPIFLVVFVAVTVRACSRSRRNEHSHAASLPLGDDR